MKLKRKVFSGGIWLFSLKIISKILGFGRTIVLARLLEPSDFGLFGIAILIISIVETFSSTGFELALVQRKEKTKDYLNTAWSFNLIKASFLTLIIFLASPFLASFFNNPQSINIIKAISLTILIKAGVNIGTIYFQKELNFKKRFRYEISGITAELITVILFALILKNVWALVFGLLASKITRLLASYLMHPWRPKFCLSLKKTKELFAFGKWLSGLNVLNFLIVQGDDLLVGKLLGTIPLGFYQMAYKISNMPATEISHLTSQISFPAYAKLQNNLLKVKKMHFNTLNFITLLSVPLAGLIFFFAGDFTKIFLGEKWLPIVPSLKVLSLWGAIRSINSSNGTLLTALGKPKMAVKIQLTKLILLATLIYPLTVKWNIWGASIAVSLAGFITFPLGTIFAFSLIGQSLFKYLKVISLSLLSISFSLFFLTLLKIVLTVNLLTFPFLVIIGISSYLFFVFLLDKIFQAGIKQKIIALLP